MLSTSRVLAIGLAAFVGGILVYFVGLGTPVRISQDHIPDGETGMRSMHAAAETLQSTSYAGGGIILLGAAIATAAAVWWFCAD